MGTNMSIKPEKAPLKKYKQKRIFENTPEPEGKINISEKEPIFVIQKHAASHLHYDFRLEINGVLKSWVIPKGPSTDPKIRRLAIPVEDHPLEYAYFEGIIPEGNYGAGKVVIWDIGTYKNITKQSGHILPINECLKNGLLRIELHGEKLIGKFALIRTNYINNKENSEQDKSWLLVKTKEQEENTKIKKN